MSKTLKIVTIIFLIAILAVAVMACQKGEKEEYTLSLAYPNIPLVYLEGEVAENISNIVFIVSDKDGNAISRHNLALSMLSAEDRENIN
ncbi:MAG: hypothetical protein WC292_07655, partial [Clostridia bacterium]